MKRMDIFCSSPASTAICSSIDQRSMVRRSHKPIFDTPQQTPRTRTTLLDHRPSLDQHHHHHSSHVPCSSQLLPINPRPYNHHFEKSRKSTSSSYTPSKYNLKQACSEVIMRRKSSADILDLKKNSQGCDSSSRYLLGESPNSSTFVLDWLPETHQSTKRITKEKDHVRQLVAANSEPEKAKLRSLTSNIIASSALIKSSSTNCRSRHQVVVLRVSLHCKGCEGKVRKHLSKMEGVTSYSIDMAAKKVTVIGDVTPLGVLASVSKVKNAQLWPSPTASSSPSSPWSA